MQELRVGSRAIPEGSAQPLSHTGALGFGNVKTPGGVACPRATRDRSGVFVL